jgi:hypothetical protein
MSQVDQVGEPAFDGHDPGPWPPIRWPERGLRSRSMLQPSTSDECGEDDLPPVAAPSSRRWHWARVALGSAAMVLAIGAILLLLSWSSTSYVGTRQHTTLVWSCRGDITWTDGLRALRWWAGPDPTLDSTLSDSPLGPDAAHHVDGELRFDSAHRATFTSDVGAIVTLDRLSQPDAHPWSCTRPR